MPADSADLARDARNAIAGALCRLQLLSRQAARGDIDPARLRAGLADAETRLWRLAALVDALEEAAEEPSPAHLQAPSAAA